MEDFRGRGDFEMGRMGDQEIGKRMLKSFSGTQIEEVLKICFTRLSP